MSWNNLIPAEALMKDKPLMDLVAEIEEKANYSTLAEWSTLGEFGEVHAIGLQDSGGDPYHICEDLRNGDAEYIAAANPMAIIRLTFALREAVEALEYCAVQPGYLHPENNAQWIRAMEALQKIGVRG